MPKETFILYRTPAGQVKTTYSPGSTQIKVRAGSIKQAYFLAGQQQAFDKVKGVGIMEVHEDTDQPAHPSLDQMQGQGDSQVLERIAHAVEAIAASLATGPATATRKRTA